MKPWIRHTAALIAFLAAAVAHAAGVVGNTFPPGFPVIEDTSLAKPVIGFGAAGPVTRTPVILLHGNNDTPIPDRLQPLRPHTGARAIPADHGIINCSPAPANYWQSPSLGGFTPTSDVCQEVGSPDTPFLQLLNGPGGSGETEGPTRVLVIRNTDVSFVYFPVQDGVFAGACDRLVRQSNGLFQKCQPSRGARDRSHGTRRLRPDPGHGASGHSELAADLAGDARISDCGLALEARSVIWCERR